MTAFAWINDPTAWLGLGTLVLLEIVLGVDNLIFVAILADKLPPHQRNSARIVGLSLALVMRLGLLAGISWIVTLTAPLFTVLGLEISGRDIILILGGLFLIFKATVELHERLEGGHEASGKRAAPAGFWQTIAQIIVLDLVFSLDSVITAVGMVNQLSVMMIAVVFAVGVMLVASRPLMDFISGRPTVVVLCLGFLLMIGFSLVVEGFGAHLPKGYLYAAIGFSVLIETFNQIAGRNRQRRATMGDLRDRTAEAVLNLLGGGKGASHPAGLDGGDANVVASPTTPEGNPVFAPEERDMIAGVLTLADRSVRSVMTPSTEMAWLDLDSDPDRLRADILRGGHSAYPVCRGSLDDVVGVARTRDLIRDLVEKGRVEPATIEAEPLIVPESASVLGVVGQLRHTRVQMALVTDEFGAVEGVVTPTDILHAIVGELAAGEQPLAGPQEADGSYLVDASVDLRRLSAALGVDLVDEGERYATLAGFLLHKVGRLPLPGERIEADGLLFEVRLVTGRRIERVRILRQTQPADAQAVGEVASGA